MTLTQQFQDTFTRPDGPIGNGWVDPNGKWTISGNRGKLNGSNSPSDLLIRPASEAFADGVAEAAVIIDYSQQNSHHSPAIWIRGDAAGNGIVAWTDGDPANVANPVLRLGKMTAFALSGVVQVAIPSLNTGNAYFIQLNATGTTFTATLATYASPPVAIVSVNLTDSSYTSGRAAVSPITDGYLSQLLNGFTVSTAPTPTPSPTPSPTPVGSAPSITIDPSAENFDFVHYDTPRVGGPPVAFALLYVTSPTLDGDATKPVAAEIIAPNAVLKPLVYSRNSHRYRVRFQYATNPPSFSDWSNEVVGREALPTLRTGNAI